MVKIKYVKIINKASRNSFPKCNCHNCLSVLVLTALVSCDQERTCGHSAIPEANKRTTYEDVEAKQKRHLNKIGP